MWSVDGTEWSIPCTVERTSEMTSSEISGMLLDKTYFNDVIGTFLRYSLRVAVPQGYEEQFNSLYEILTEPVDGHAFTFPYAGGVISVTGRVENIRDSWVRLPNGKQKWRGIAFDVLPNHPQKTVSLGDVLTRGVAPLPDETDVNVGETYQYAQSGWEIIDDAEDNLY